MSSYFNAKRGKDGLDGVTNRPKSAHKAEPRFDRDLAYGRQAELQIDEFLDWIANRNGCVEVKHKRYLDHKLYVELEKDPGRTGYWRPGGINETAAHLWCYVIDDTGIHVAIPTDLLREAIADPSSKRAEERDGSCPTRGYLIDFCVLLYRVKQRRARGNGSKV